VPLALPDPSLPLALVLSERGTLRVVAVNAAAATEGIGPGQSVSDARALYPGLKVHPADPAADAKGLAGLAEWCERYSPWAATDGEDGVRIDITGSAHLFGGEAALIDDLAGRLRRMGLSARIAIADSPGAAWAWSHYGKLGAAGADGILAPGGASAALEPLPIAALRLTAEPVAGLRRLGLYRIGDLYRMPRAPLAARFGGQVAWRLDQALGREEEPISPPRPVPAFQVSLRWAEAIGERDAIQAATETLLARLGRLLEEAHQGARRLELALHRVDGSVARVAIGTARAARDPRHLMRLFGDRLDAIDPGFGIEAMILSARATDRLDAGQLALGNGAGPSERDAVGRLVDRLQNRLGRRNVVALDPVDSHIPERAVRFVAAGAQMPTADGGFSADQPRPIRMLPSPEPIEAMAPVPDDPPVWFRWRRLAHRIVRAEGPERIAPEWWRHLSESTVPRVRDYYRLEDDGGRRFWVYRDGLYETDDTDDAPTWYMHGVFS